MSIEPMVASPDVTRLSVPPEARSAAPGAPTAGRAAPRTERPPLARLYMTSDLRAATGLARTHLDFYLREGLIIPTARTESGYLLFDDAELETLRTIIALRQDGHSIKEIRAALGR